MSIFSDIFGEVVKLLARRGFSAGICVEAEDRAVISRTVKWQQKVVIVLLSGEKETFRNVAEPRKSSIGHLPGVIHVGGEK